MARQDSLTTARRIRRQLSSQQRMEVGQLFFDITSSATDLTLVATPPASLRAGTIICIDLEVMWVASVNTATNVVSVIRGYLDSDAAVHLALALVEIAPRFTMLDIVDAMINELNAWGPQLYRTVDQTFTVDTTVETLQLPLAWADLYGVCQVRQSEVGTTNTVWPQLACKLVRGSAAGFAGASTSGVLLRFLEPLRSGSVHVVAALPFDATTVPTNGDLLATIGMSNSQLDVLELGVRRRLLLQGDNDLNARQSQDDSRLAEENPVAGMLSIHQLQLALYTRRRTEEANRLARLYPIRMQ